MKANRGLTVRRMVELGGVSRASFYRFDEESSPRGDRDMDLRDAIQRIALKWPSYGRPRITAELRRQGWRVGPNRVRRLMREDNLLCVRKRKFVVTTDSNHGRKVYPNLASEMELSGINQLWVADITYIRLETEFVYLAVVIDAFSRRVIGWALDRTLEDDLPLEALRMAAFEQRQPAAGLVHHSDRGSQYASHDYTDLLKARGCEISMSHKASPWENGGCESWMKTLKYEEVFRQEYRDLAEARSCLERFIDKVYNQQRLHSALGYRPPAEFEQALAGAAARRSAANVAVHFSAASGRSCGGGKGAHYRETLQATGCYVGRIVIATAEFAPMPPSLYRATPAVLIPTAIRMRFLRHDGIYRSDVDSNQNQPWGGAGDRLPPVGPEPRSKNASGGSRSSHRPR